MDIKKQYETPETWVGKMKTERLLCASGNNWDGKELPGFEFND